MANNCAFYMIAVSPYRDALVKLVDILNYDDPDWFIYRVFSNDAEKDNIQKVEGTNLYRMAAYGDVAWTCSSWVEHISTPLDERERDEKGGRYTNLVELSKALGISFEVYAEECGCEFGQYLHVSQGEVITEDSCDYQEFYVEDEDDLEYLLDVVHNNRERLSPEEDKYLEEMVWEFREAIAAGKPYEFSYYLGGYNWRAHTAEEIWATVPLDHDELGFRSD
jgi:hypothetical protein